MTGLCLACGSKLGGKLFELEDVPLVDSFVPRREDAIRVPRYTIKLAPCLDCKSLQIVNPPDTRGIYENYIYESGTSPDLSEHFTNFVTYVENLGHRKDALIVEVGANDGLLLRILHERGYQRMVAIDPSPQTAAIKISGVTILNSFFNEDVKVRLGEEKAFLIIANNCFSHIPDLLGKLKLCKSLLATGGAIIVEVQSALSLLENVVFDYIYHEHYFYHSALSFRNLVRRSGLNITKIDLLPTKGGSYRFTLAHEEDEPETAAVDYWLYKESLVEINALATWNNLYRYLELIKHQTHQFLENNLDKRLVGYGASATGTVLIKYLGLEDRIELIVDDNPGRQGLYAPGSGIPVKDNTELRSSDLCIVLAWRHSGLIQKRLRKLSVPHICPLPFFEKFI